MKGVPAERRSAHFLCVLTFIGPKGLEHCFEGRCDGSLLQNPAGSHGFGYDPLFVPEGYTESFASLGPRIKNTLSARSRAWRKFGQWVLSHC
jgi:XTP/dITP diphosphohydrolase